MSRKFFDDCRNYVIELAKRKVILGFDEFCSNRPSKRALLSYLVLPLLPPPAFRDRTKFSNRGIAQAIPRVLNELGYVVDIVNYDNEVWVPSGGYDLFIGHGGINFERISTYLPPSTLKIYFATGLYWREWNIRLAKRMYELAVRRGWITDYRSIQFDEDYGTTSSQGIICLGNRTAAETYWRFHKVVGINNGIFPLHWEGWRSKDYDRGRKHFLFFSGRGSVLKGLDVVLEAFAQTGLHLHICHHMENDFVRCYRRELMECSNIHVHGFVQMRSIKFEEVASSCNWVISGTCAEGQPGAVLECMSYGLIPILPDAANIDLGNWGVRLENCDVETIRETIIAASAMSPEECKSISEYILKDTREAYSAERFVASFRAAIEDILHERCAELE